MLDYYNVTFSSPWVSRNLKELIDLIQFFYINNNNNEITLSCKDNNKERTKTTLKLPPVNDLFLVSCVVCSVDREYHWDPGQYALYLALDVIV